MEQEPGTSEQETRGDVVVLHLVGEHDMSTAESLRAELRRLAGLGSGGGLVVSLTDMTFMDASIVGALFDADELLRRRGRELVLHVATASIVQRVLEVSGLT